MTNYSLDENSEETLRYIFRAIGDQRNNRPNASDNIRDIELAIA